MHTNSTLPAVTAGQQSIAVSDERDLGAFIPSFLDDFGLDPYEFRVYCRIARRAGAGGQCWESINNMAKACRMNRKTVMQALSSLLRLGMIRQTKRPGKPDLYKLTHHTHWGKPDQSDQETLTTSPSDGHLLEEPVRVADTTNPCEGHHQSFTRTAPVRVKDTKVFPEGSPSSSWEELEGEQNDLPPTTQPPPHGAAAVVVHGSKEQSSLVGLKEKLEIVRAAGFPTGIWWSGDQLQVTVDGWTMTEQEFIGRSLDSFRRDSEPPLGLTRLRAQIAELERRQKLRQQPNTGNRVLNAGSTNEIASHR